MEKKHKAKLLGLLFNKEISKEEFKSLSKNKHGFPPILFVFTSSDGTMYGKTNPEYDNIVEVCKRLGVEPKIIEGRNAAPSVDQICNDYQEFLRTGKIQYGFDSH